MFLHQQPTFCMTWEATMEASVKVEYLLASKSEAEPDILKNQ